MSHLALLLHRLPRLTQLLCPQVMAPVLLATLLVAEVVVLLLAAEVLTQATRLAVVIQEATPATAATLLGKATAAGQEMATAEERAAAKAIRKNEIGPRKSTLLGPDAPEPKTP